MINFIKRLLGLAPTPEKTAEEVKAIFIPQMTTAAPNSAKTLEAQYIPPAKPKFTEGKTLGGNGTVKKVRAITEKKPGVPPAPKSNKPKGKQQAQSNVAKPSNKNKPKHK